MNCFHFMRSCAAATSEPMWCWLPSSLARLLFSRCSLVCLYSFVLEGSTGRGKWAFGKQYWHCKENQGGRPEQSWEGGSCWWSNTEIGWKSIWSLMVLHQQSSFGLWSGTLRQWTWNNMAGCHSRCHKWLISITAGHEARFAGESSVLTIEPWLLLSQYCSVM